MEPRTLTEVSASAIALAQAPLVAGWDVSPPFSRPDNLHHLSLSATPAPSLDLVAEVTCGSRHRPVRRPREVMSVLPSLAWQEATLAACLRLQVAHPPRPKKAC